MEAQFKIAGVVVLFNSGKGVLENLETYCSQIGRLYAVDNSSATNASLSGELGRIKKVSYIHVGRNSGVAHALNLGAKLAIEEGYDFLLTMDDDSRAAPDMIGQFLMFLKHRKDIDSIGLVSPFHFYANYTDAAQLTNKEVPTAITSGTLLNLRAYEKVGPFLDELFIDYVDFEYCLRLRRNGFMLYQVGGAVLHHTLGDLVPHRVLFRKIGATHHSSLRIYYRTRNRLYVAKKYFTRFPGFVVSDFIIFGNELIKILLFETERTQKMKMVLRGVFDFIINTSGEYRRA